MLEATYISAFLAAFFVAIFDWRKGLLLCVIFDVIRDPTRKLITGQPVLITITAAVLWVAAFFGASRALGPKLFLAVRTLPAFGNAVTALLIGLTPAAVISTFSYPAGWQVAALGYTSYMLPLLGVAVGSQLISRPKQLWEILGVYCIANSIALTGTILEFLKIDWPALGGLRNMVWIRYEEGYIVELISGFYRSPDVMGLHAANCAMFAGLLALRKHSRFKFLWIGLVIFSTICLILSGRRKMIGMLLVFCVVYIGIRVRQSGIGKMLPFFIIMILFTGTVFFIMSETQQTATYTNYAQTTITQGGDRLQNNLFGGIAESLRQAGFMGHGLGTVTQGRYYTDAKIGVKTWQEDGVTRVFAEMGIFGAIFCIIAIFNLVWAGWIAFKMVPHNSAVHELQTGMLAVILANGASFAVSHQAYSGDPSSLLFVSLLMGVLYAGPLQIIKQSIESQRRNQLGPREISQSPKFA